MLEIAGLCSGTAGRACEETGIATTAPSSRVIKRLDLNIGMPCVDCESHDNGDDGLHHPWSDARKAGAHSQNAITIVLSSPSTRLMRFGLCTMPATPCVGAIVRKPRGRSSSRTTLGAPACAFPFSANFLPMHSLQSSTLTVAWAVPGICLIVSALAPARTRTPL